MCKGFNINKITGIVLKLFILTALILPVITTKAENPETNGYYSEIILHNGFVLMFMFLFIWGCIRKKVWNRQFMVAVILLLFVLAAYNFFYCRNAEIIQFPWGQINTSISLGFFILLLAGKVKSFFQTERIIGFTMASIIITNIVGLIVYYKGYLSAHMYNFKLILTKIDPDFYEKRFHWIYFYKCEYSCMLLLFIAFFVANRKVFCNKILYLFGLGILFWCLIVAHTNTSLAGAGLIVLADLLDWLSQKKRGWCWFVPVGIAGIFAGKELFQHIGAERDMSSLGARIPIWTAAIKRIKETPQGIGNQFDVNYKEYLQVTTDWKTNNCHNIFLNEMFRFSIPVGISYFMFFLIICIYSLIKKFNLMRLATWAAFFIAVSMDYSLQTPELSMAMFMLYGIFFYPLEEKKESRSEE